MRRWPASNGLTYLEQGDHSSDTLTVATQDQGTAFTATNTVAINVTAVAINSAPVTGPTTISLLENASYTFKSSDFPYADPNNTPATALKAVIFATLPGAGTITDNGVPIPAGQAVAAGDIAQGKLVYTPAANGFGARYATFTFAVQNSGGTANGGVDTSSAATATINVAQVINKYDSSGHLISTEAIYADGSYDVRYYTAGTFSGVAYASVDRAYTAANVQTVTTYYDGSGNVVATETFTANGGFTITVGGTLFEQKTVNADSSYDVRYYTAGTFSGVAYASVDRAYTAANVQTVTTYYDGSGNVVATETFTANGGFTITVGGTLFEQKTVNADGSYDVRYYVAGTFSGVAYASVDRAYTAANVQTVTTYYDGSGNVVATETFTANGGFTITVGGTLFEQKTVNADSSYDVRYYVAGTFSGVAYASVDRAYTAANVQTVTTYYDGSGNVVATESFTANGGFTITVGGTLFEQKTVNADSSYDVRYYVAGTFSGVAYASVDRAYTAANVLTAVTYYDGSGKVVASQIFADASDDAAASSGDQSDVVPVSFDDPADGVISDVQLAGAAAIADDFADSSGQIVSGVEVVNDGQQTARNAPSLDALMLGADYVSTPRGVELNAAIGPTPTRTHWCARC